MFVVKSVCLYVLSIITLSPSLLSHHFPGLAPIYGKLSDIIGRKPILFSSIFFFLLGSALCGAAQTFIWLALCRGLQGIGGGGIMQMVLITMSDISAWIGFLINFHLLTNFHQQPLKNGGNTED